MKTSTAIIFASLILLLGVIFYSFSNRYYIDSSTGLILDRMTGEVKQAIPETPDWGKIYPWAASDFETEDPVIDKGDFSKVVISGHSTDNSKRYMLPITCTVQNNDSIPHKLTVKAIFYGKDKKPILTKDFFEITVAVGDIESVVITAHDNVENIESYELKLIQSEYDGVIANFVLIDTTNYSTQT